VDGALGTPSGLGPERWSGCECWVGRTTRVKPLAPGDAGGTTVTDDPNLADEDVIETEPPDPGKPDEPSVGQATPDPNEVDEGDEPKAGDDR
jgi:hypothetical protein